MLHGSTRAGSGLYRAVIKYLLKWMHETVWIRVLNMSLLEGKGISGIRPTSSSVFAEFTGVLVFNVYRGRHNMLIAISE